MACCKCCCGGEDCTEGQEGKCCCGGSSGTCCDVGEYCCSGVCSAEPCGCPTGGLCDCPDSGIPPLFLTNWPGELSPAIVVDCDVAPAYLGESSGSFSCASSGTCAWTVTVEADITCATIDSGTQCGSDCTLSNVTITVDDSACDCPGELPDTSTFEYFYCA